MVTKMLEQLREKAAQLEVQLGEARRLLRFFRNEKIFYKQKASLMETVISGCRDSIYMYDRGGRFVYASPAGAEALGIESDEIEGRTCRELGFPHALTEPFQADMERVFVTGQVLAGKTVLSTVSGKRAYEYLLEPVSTKDGAVDYVVATVREVLYRKKPESEQEGQYMMMEAIFENTLFPMAVMDRHFNFIRVNEAYARADDREVADFAGHNHFDFYPSDAREIFEQVIKTKEPCQIIARPFVYQDNPERGITYWDWMLAPVLDSSGEVDKLIFSLLDVTRSVKVEIALRNTLMETRKRNEEISALLKSSQAVLEYKSFKDAARAIYQSCRDLLGATAGYICIKNRDGKYEAIYIEAGDRSCTVESSLPMPEIGMWEEAYRSGDIVWENNFPGSRWVNLLPEGHVSLDNVLHAPLVIEGEIWGLIAFGNKPGGFSENDIKMVSALSRDISIALYNSRLLESLRHSEEHFRSVVQSATDAIITTDSAGTILFWNDAATNVFGYSVEEAVGRLLTLIMPEDFLRLFLEGVGRLKGKEKSSLSEKLFEKVGLRKDGLEVPVEVSVSCWESNGEVYLTGIVRDLSWRRQTEENVLRLASIVESTDDAVIGITLDGAVLAWNRGAEKLYGYKAGEVWGRPVALILLPENSEEVNTILDKIKKGQLAEHYETVHVRKHGRDIHVSVSISPVKNPLGNITGASIIARDISERKKMELELNKSRRRFANILESMAEAFIALDHGWRFIYINREAEQAWQRNREELTGRNIWEVFPQTVGTELYTECHRAMEGGIAVNFEMATLYTGRIYEVLACPSTDGLSVFFRDVSGRKEMEKEMARLDRLNLVGQMAAGIGHEIRNPMTSIRGFLQILSGKSECDSYRDYFDLMIEELDRANTIITEFLSLARNKTPEMRMQNINRVVEALSPLLTADAINSKKEIALELGEVPEIPLDEKEIRQLILNLARNGVEAMDSEGKLTIKTFLEGGEVVLAVQDQGIGISDGIIEHIGVPFFTTKENGTGLGLATCYSIASRHNAYINVDTGPQGTTFFVRFRY